MCKISVINIVGKLDSTYIEALQKDQHEVVLLEFSNLNDSLLAKSDVVIIYDEFQESIGEICKLILELKANHEPHIWIISNQENETNRLLFLKLGAVGNIQSQYSPDEVRLIINNTVRYHEKELNHTNQTDWIQLNDQNRSLLIEGEEEIQLTNLEYKMIDLLFSQKGTVFSYEEMEKKIWNENGTCSAKPRIANLVFHIRNKISNEAAKDFIKNVRSRGYMAEISRKDTRHKSHLL
ncbi:winged helix-turn-helix domain-containing protein [Enterococcus sp. UD-01]|uniref:winged helix-turn-helix domain-containing protein n=1 Tax=Enterococcus sp. UD-01 TaxID=3373911 RepID=UPI0038399644